MKNRTVKKVFAGKDLIFALGDDVNASTSNLRESQASSGLQEIPERDEKSNQGMASIVANGAHQSHNHPQNMPILNLSKLNKGSTGSLKKISHQ